MLKKKRREAPFVLCFLSEKIDWKKKGQVEKMDLALDILVIIECIMGFLSTAYVIVSLIGTLIFKFYRTAKYKISLFD